MKATEINPEAVLFANEALEKDTPFYMLNLLRFKEQADYGEYKDFKPCSGREAYLTRYAPAFNKVTEGDDIKLLIAGTVITSIVGPSDEHWELAALVEYPSFTAFKKVIESESYKTVAEPHRLAALEDLRLIATVNFPV